MPTLGGRKPTSAGDSGAGWLGTLQPHRARPCEEQARGREAPHRCLGSEPAHLLLYRTVLLRRVRNRWDDYGDRAAAGAAVTTEVPDTDARPTHPWSAQQRRDFLSQFSLKKRNNQTNETIRQTKAPQGHPVLRF